MTPDETALLRWLRVSGAMPTYREAARAMEWLPERLATAADGLGALHLATRMTHPLGDRHICLTMRGAEFPIADQPGPGAGGV